MFKSPWLDFKRKTWPALTGNNKTQVTIIGGGISGIATLYFLLLNTPYQVTLVEQKQIASGATGHNAAFVVSAIERSAQTMLEEYGVEMTKSAFAELDSAWDMLRNILSEIDAEEELIPFHYGVMGFNSLSKLISYIQEEKVQQKLGRARWKFLVADQIDLSQKHLEEFKKDVNIVPQQKIQEALQIESDDYIACAIPIGKVQFARMNSAKFCYNLLEFLEKKFPERFFIYENTAITQIDIHPDNCILQHSSGTIETEKVILCTNAYQDFLIVDKEQNKMVTKLKTNVTQVDAYMAGYIDNHPETALRAFRIKEEEYANVPLFYWSRANIPATNKMLAVIGGPEYTIENRSERQMEEQARESFMLYQTFLKKTLQLSLDSFDYFWHGTMGYTANGLRWVGKDPNYSHVLYNLGCNGIGILPAIVGANKISGILNGQSYAPSLFDPE